MAEENITTTNEQSNTLNGNTEHTSCRIFYSTQTGRARACARRTARIIRECSNLPIEGISSFDDAPNFIDLVQDFSKRGCLLLLFVSTTGDGDHCDVIKRTWKELLKKSHPPDLFQGGSFSMFCLGDRAYGEQFCAAGRKLAVRLMQLGMKSKCELGYGDDGTPNGGVFATLDNWIENDFLPVLPSPMPVAGSTPAQALDSTPTTLYRVTVSDDEPQKDSKLEEWRNKEFDLADSYLHFFKQVGPMTAYSYDHSMHRELKESEGDYNSHEPLPPLIGEISCNERITASDWEQNTRHIEILISSQNQNYSIQSNGTVSPTASHGQSQTHMLPYQAGDVASILPANLPNEVQKFIDVLPKSLQQVADRKLVIHFDEVSAADTSADSFTSCKFWPSTCTLRGWLTYCADIHSLPEREDLRALSFYCDTENHALGKDQRDMLFSLSETSKSALYVDYILRQKRCWADVLYDFDSLGTPDSKLSIEALLTLLSPIRPRDYSIASAPSQQKIIPKQNVEQLSGDDNTAFQIDLCVAVVEGKTPLGRSYHGLCSHYLSTLQVSTVPDPKTGADNVNDDDSVFIPSRPCVHIWIRPGTFGGLPLTLCEKSDVPRITRFFESPILCIGAGTGVAPLRALILEREAVRLLSSGEETKNNENNSDDNMTNSGLTSVDESYDNILLFGCRSEKADYYYEKDWEKMMAGGGRLFVSTAFSRDQVQRIYVQRKLRDPPLGGDFLRKHILERNGAIYIAGNPEMAKAVKEELVESLSKSLGKNEKYVSALLKKMQKLGRFSVEAWS